MQCHHFLLLSILLLTTSTNAHNITQILASHPDFSTFNHYLSVTHLASEINRRQTITVLAITNSEMSTILSKHLTLPTLKNLLSLHILVDYFGAKKLHQITGGTAMASTVFQSSGQAQGMAGFVNITDRRAGKVTFRAEGSDKEVEFVKSVKEIPYNISVVQITEPLESDVAEAPTPSVAEIDFVGIMARKGCKTYSDLISAGTGEIVKIFENKINGSGLTIFCPIDQAMEAFMPRFKNLTEEQKISVLLYHGIPSYNSIDMLKSKTGIVTTLATSTKSKDFNLTIKNEGEVVTLKTRVTSASITGTLVDQDPLAVYTIDEVLEPRELFEPEKKAAAPAPEPAEAPIEAEAPKGAKGKKKKHVHAPPPAPEGPAPGPSDDGDAADEEVADDNFGRRVGVDGGKVVAAVVAALMVVAY